MSEASKCYGWKGIDGSNGKVAFIGCAVEPGWDLNNIYGGAIYSFPSDRGINITGNGGYGAKPVSITPFMNQAEIDAWKIGYSIITGNCHSCPIFTPNLDCPPGTCKCPSPIYPGYCCLDCAGTVANIQAITNELRRKNG